MTSERGAVQCVMALVLLLLVQGQGADLKWSVKGKSEFNTRLRAFPHLESLPKVNAQNKPERHRAMLQFLAQQFCFFSDNECIPDTLTNNPDDQTLNMFLKRVDCLDNTTPSACNSQPDCLWATDTCGVDFTLAIQQCLDPTYLTIRRGLFDCEDLPTESKCTVISGCTWNGVTCEADQDTVLAALQSNAAAAAELIQQGECQDSLSCPAPCETTQGSCFFPDFFDFSDFVTSTTPFCNYIRQVVACESTFNPLSCTGACELTDAGLCFFPFVSTEFVDITFVSNPGLQAQMRTAVQQCPSISLPSACNAFIP